MANLFPDGDLSLNTGHSLYSRVKALIVPRSATTFEEVYSNTTMTMTSSNGNYNSDGYYWDTSAGAIWSSGAPDPSGLTTQSSMSIVWRAASLGAGTDVPTDAIYPLYLNNSVDNIRFYATFDTGGGSSRRTRVTLQNSQDFENFAADPFTFPDGNDWTCCISHSQGSQVMWRRSGGTTTQHWTGSTSFFADRALDGGIYVVDGASNPIRWRYSALFSDKLSQAEFETIADDPGALVGSSGPDPSGARDQTRVITFRNTGPSPFYYGS